MSLANDRCCGFGGACTSVDHLSHEMMSGLGAVSNWAERAERGGFRISALASDCGVSERQLRRFIEATFGQPPHAWIMGHRLRQATELLKTDLLLKQIADRLGFQTEEHFSREFRKLFGVSPRSYRRRWRS